MSIPLSPSSLPLVTLFASLANVMAAPGDDVEDEHFLSPGEDLKEADFDLDEPSLNSTLASPSTSPNKPGTGESRWRRSVTGNETTTARKRGLPNVQEDGVDDTYRPVGFGEFGRYMRNKRAKLINQNNETLDHDGAKPQIFAKLAIYINGWTGKLGLPEMQNLLISHGGRYVPYLDKKSMVTHIIATNLTPSKQKEFAAYKVVRPDWLVDSAQEGKLKDWRAYALLAAPVSEERVVDEYGQERLVSGTQRSLFGMLGGAGKGKDTEPPSTNVETIESLSARGARLAQEALKSHQLGASSTSSSLKSFFGGSTRPTKPSALSRAVTPTEQPTQIGEASRPSRPATPEQGANLAATTDSPDKPTEVTHSWLPKAQRSERQNALLQDENWLNQHSSRSPDFLAGYFAQSRLHHLSTFKEELKLLVTKYYAEHPPPAKKSKKKLTGSVADGRTIMHVDLDMFFVSAGLTTRPEMAGQPIAVCHSRGKEGADSSTSEIASCSYEARAAGVKNGMSLGRARELCPDIVTIPFEFDLYKEISLKFYNILLSHATFLQAGSMDEVFLEVTVPQTITRESDPALVLANRIRDEIHAATGCHASIGIGHNMLLARLATRKAKPNGAFHLFSEDVHSYLADLAVDDLPGIGWAMRNKLNSELGVKTVGDLLRFSKFDLARAIGPKNAETYLAYARGLDARELAEGKERGSVSSEVNYGIRFAEGRHDQAERFVRELAEETATRLNNLGLTARHLNLKLMVRHPEAAIETPKMLGHGWVNTYNKPSSLAGPNGATDDPTIIGDSAVKLLRAFDFPPHELRGIGVQLQKLERDGVPVDAVREKGQNTLSFQPTRPGKTAPSAPLDRTPSPDGTQLFPAAPPSPRTVDPALPPPAPVLPPSAQQRRASPTVLRKEPSVIVLDSDEDNDVSPPPQTRASRSSRSPRPPHPLPKPPPVRRGSTKQQPAYIPSMFRQSKQSIAPPGTAKSISKRELQKLGIEPAIYHELPEQFQRDAIEQARRALPVRKTVTSTKGKEVALPSVPSLPPSAPLADLTLSSSSPAASTSRLEVLVLPPTPDAAPTETQRVRDILGDEVWGALGSKTQKETVRYLQQQDALSVKGNHSRSTASSSRPSAPVKDVKIRLPPRFDRHSDLDGICDLIESWVEGAQDGPEIDDLEALGRFVEKCAMREKGHDLKKATDVMNWWSSVIEGAFGGRARAEGAGKVWWERYDEVVGRLEWVVLKETGCKLVL
ncbi:hypothetical protein JCM11251_003449 [Rhodosporidiobolus azoricus]